MSQVKEYKTKNEPVAPTIVVTSLCSTKQPTKDIDLSFHILNTFRLLHKAEGTHTFNPRFSIATPQTICYIHRNLSDAIINL